MKLTLVKGGRRESSDRNVELNRRKSLHERMTRIDRALEMLYKGLAFSSRAPFCMTLWATGKLGGLHGKYNYPSSNEMINFLKNG